MWHVPVKNILYQKFQNKFLVLIKDEILNRFANLMIKLLYEIIIKLRLNLHRFKLYTYSILKKFRKILKYFGNMLENS